jgi:hypothetical protein
MAGVCGEVGIGTVEVVLGDETVGTAEEGPEDEVEGEDDAVALPAPSHTQPAAVPCCAAR